jgi:hypothetical protein
MRRDINWTVKRDDGSRYEVRVHWFSKQFKFQFRERGTDRWDYERQPSREDLETFLDTIDRRYHRKQATLLEFEAAQRLWAAAPPAEEEG